MTGRRTDWNNLPRFAWTLFAAAAVLSLVAGVLAIVEGDALTLAWLGQSLLWTGFAVVAFRGRRRVSRGAHPGR